MVIRCTGLLILACALSSLAQATVLTYTALPAWQAEVAARGGTVTTDDLHALASGTYFWIRSGYVIRDPALEARSSNGDTIILTSPHDTLRFQFQSPQNAFGTYIIVNSPTVVSLSLDGGAPVEIGTAGTLLSTLFVGIIDTGAAHSRFELSMTSSGRHFEVGRSVNYATVEAANGAEIPEPASMGLAAVGLAALLLRRRRAL